jgi:predicted DNA-binding transcriptional regulator AlpA
MRAEKEGRWFAQVLCLFLMGTLLSGCLSLSKTTLPDPWYTAYQPITDPESVAFVELALGKAEDAFGRPVIPVNKVILRHSQKTEAAWRYRIEEGFSRTVCEDTTNGVFVICIGESLDHPNFFPLLGHECAHLLNPHITDWYMEGIASVFSEQMCREFGRAWGDWERHFKRSRRGPYALSYRMMRELQQTFPDQYPLIPRFTTANRTRKGWLRIDIDAWLADLTEDQRDEALDIIEPYVKKLNRKVSPQYDFTVPAELK